MGEEGTAVRSGTGRETLHVGPVRLHGIDLHVTVTHAREGDEPIGCNRRLGVVARGARQRGDARTIRARAVDVVAVVDRPYVAAGEIRARGAARRRLVGRRVDDLAATGKEVAARGAPHPGADTLKVGAIDLHREDLVARHALAGGLEDEAAAVGREVRFGILATVGELADVG